MQQSQFPPTGTFVLRDTPVARRRWVRIRGIILVVLGAVMVIDAIGFAVWLHFMFK